MLKKAALTFGIIFTLVGILGFIPGFTTPGPDGNALLLGLFEVNATHNIVHLLSGLAGLAAAANARYAKMYLIGLGAVYALVTLLGLFMDPVLGLLPVNGADNLLHLLLTVGLLGAGLGLKEDREATTV